MAITDILDRLTLTRRLVRALERQATALEQQAVFLARLADHFAPLLPTTSDDQVRSTGVDFLRQAQAGRYLEWEEGFRERQGRDPSEDEIDEWYQEDEERT